MDSVSAQAVEAQAVDASAAPAQASEDENGQEFFASFDALAQAIRRARGAVPQDRPGLLTFSQYALLTPLATNHAARVSDLAAEASIAPSTATRILDALERRAIVRRDRSDEDRRQVRITLTERGRRTLCAQDEWMRGRQRAFFEELPEVERELVADLLLRLSKLIDELAAGPEG